MKRRAGEDAHPSKRIMSRLSASPPRGLHNRGNTCYANATLQLLRAWASLPAEARAWVARDPAAVLPQVYAEYAQFRGGGQHDAHEFLLACLDLVVTQGKAPLRPGKLRSVVECNCTGDTSEVEEPFTVLSIALTHPTLAGCVDHEIHRKEQLSGAEVWRSPASESQSITPVSSTKHIEIASWPAEGVVFHLKRFRNNRTKLQQPIQCPVHWMERPLRAAVLHHGSCSGGHYTAVVHTGSAWYHCNDARVSPVPATQAMRLIMQSGYLLLFSSAG